MALGEDDEVIDEKVVNKPVALAPVLQEEVTRDNEGATSCGIAGERVTGKHAARHRRMQVVGPLDGPHGEV